MTDLSKLSAQELETLAKDAAAMAEKRKEQEKKDLRSELVDRIKSEGYSIDDIFPGAGSSWSKAKALTGVKYQDPSNPANTWTGKGRKPKWLVEAESAGRSVDEFAV